MCWVREWHWTFEGQICVLTGIKISLSLPLHKEILWRHTRRFMFGMLISVSTAQLFPTKKYCCPDHIYLQTSVKLLRNKSTDVALSQREPAGFWHVNLMPNSFLYSTVSASLNANQRGRSHASFFLSQIRLGNPITFFKRRCEKLYNNRLFLGSTSSMSTSFVIWTSLSV